jgi:VanZ family protein
MLPLRHGNVWLAAGAALVALVVYGSLSASPQTLPGMTFDKLNHFAAYAVLAFWATGLVRRPHYGKVALALAALGLSLEAAQYAMAQGRMAEPLDMVANLAGIAAGLLTGTPFASGWTGRVEAWLARE